MNTSKLADYSEIIGSVAVVLSLIFVGMQLNEGNRETRAATTQVALQSTMDLQRTFALHAGTWDKVVSGEPLASGEEMRRGILLFNLLMTDDQNLYHQFESGFLDAGTWEGRRSTLPQIVSLPMYEIWKNSIGSKGHSADFLELLDSAAVGAFDD